ncbi:hypothetical protein [Peribacillus kribbensis]|uniref:hypothetical protein n=1 Tax=Peribacillus kribbensis TaxID=356658 RepID=UPI000421D28A|nr:hypothetical protein [Peribacillus kribbensis]
MRRLLYVLSFFFLLFIIYYDLTAGTIPVRHSVTSSGKLHVTEEPQEQENKQENKTDAGIPFTETKIEAGDTILSIIEQREGKLNKPIEDVIADFRKLNNGKEPEDIQIGKSYKIPRYKE